MNHKWDHAAAVCRCGNCFLFSLQGDVGEISRRLKMRSGRCAEVSSGHHWNAAHHNTRTNVTDRFPARRVITVMRLSPWRCPRVTDDSQDRWRMPPAVEITAGKSRDFHRRSNFTRTHHTRETFLLPDRKRPSGSLQELITLFCGDRPETKCRLRESSLWDMLYKKLFLSWQQQKHCVWSRWFLCVNTKQRSKPSETKRDFTDWNTMNDQQVIMLQ